MTLTCLKIGDVVTVDADIRIWAGQYHHRPNLMYGLAIQKQHDRILQNAGFEIKIFEDTFPLDRIIPASGNCRQDDKYAMIRGGKLSESHTIGVTEYPDWENRTEDTIIHSFLQISEDDPWVAKYDGAYSFKKIQKMGDLKWGNRDSTKYFFRSSCKYARV